MTYLDIYNINGSEEQNKKWNFVSIIIVLFIMGLFIAFLLWAGGVFDKKEEKVVQPVQPIEPIQPSEPSSFTNIEPFTNDLPYQLENKSMKLSEEVDYNEVLQDMALDNEVKSQHKQYVTDRNKVTSTASFVPARSDTQDIVPRWGLTTNTYIPIDSSAREIPSQDPEQGPKPVRLRWN